MATQEKVSLEQQATSPSELSDSAVAEEKISYTREEEKRMVRKMDFRVLTLVSVLFMVSPCATLSSKATALELTLRFSWNFQLSFLDRSSASPSQRPLTSRRMSC